MMMEKSCHLSPCKHPPAFEIVALLPGLDGEKILPIPWYLCQSHADTVPPYRVVGADQWVKAVDHMAFEVGVFLPPYSEIKLALRPL